MKAAGDWLEARTGLVSLVRRVFWAPLPGGATWRRSWLAALGFVFLVQVVTGFFLLTGYSASTQTAWESVFHLQFQTPGGWLLRGLHVVAAQAFVVLLALHLLQVVIAGAYRAPRELNLWLVLGLLPLALAQSVTGWLLPFDQKGYWAARVPLNILGVVPGVGPWLQTLLLGGSEVGHHTLTRFLALHATVLPLTIGAALLALWQLDRRGGETAAAPDPARPAAWWPDQALRDAVVCLAVLVTLLFFVLRPRLAGAPEPFPELLAPADPAEPFAAARPEWFMLFLFQFLKYFPAGTEVWGAVVIPTLVFLVIALMPWIGRWRLGARFNTAFILALALGAITLGALAWREDRDNAHYQAAVRAAREAGARARALAAGGIPPGGALELVHADPWSQGPKLFARHCAGCHRYDGHDGLGGLPADPPSASDLKGFASREWLAGLLDPARVATAHYFGGTRFAEGRMVRFVQRDVAGFNEWQQAALQKVIVAVSAEAALPAQAEADARDAALIAEGRELIRTREMKCTSCHQFRVPDEDAVAPDLTGYGSRAWLVEFIRDPAHPRFYGKRNDRMPRFGAEALLSEQEVGLLADWLRGDWPEPVRP
jgi:ubiquinol-cytochrome c reductase cytochrome b subunit